MASQWPTDQQGREHVEMGKEADLPKQIRALMQAIHDLREDVALLERATGVPPAGERGAYPQALEEIPDLRDAIAALLEAVQGTLPGDPVAASNLQRARGQLRLD